MSKTDPITARREAAKRIEDRVARRRAEIRMLEEEVERQLAVAEMYRRQADAMEAEGLPDRPTDDELAAARKRLKPYMDGY